MLPETVGLATRKQLQLAASLTAVLLYKHLHMHIEGNTIKINILDNSEPSDGHRTIYNLADPDSLHQLETLVKNTKGISKAIGMDGSLLIFLSQVDKYDTILETLNKTTVEL